MFVSKSSAIFSGNLLTSKSSGSEDGLDEVMFLIFQNRFTMAASVSTE